ncbi:MAG: hypothetical protein DMG78_19170 [Acidobacteria bacterium]|nr:MAG: hypothetical protein DMG78_19170 [Acidobacteriota bacterium]
MAITNRGVIDLPPEVGPVLREDSAGESQTPITRTAKRELQKTVWIDLDNSPHVPFFLPIIEELKNQGVEILLTARNTYQVCDLLDFFHLQCKVVGRHYGKHRMLKVLGNILRACQLAPTMVWRQPDLAVSHGSRAQIVVGRTLGIPTLMMQDYEYSARTGFLEADWILTPEVVPNSAMSRRPGRVLKYPGLKEDVYVPGFRPDPSIRQQLGISSEDLVVTLRPPATEAHYHNHKSDILFAEALKFLDRPHITIVTLPRSHRQDQSLRNEWPDLIASRRMIIPKSAVDGLNLIWFSDLVISGGGTMNREAAALGAPVYSIFRGTIGAVDAYLAQQGRLTLIECAADLEQKIALQRWHRPSRPNSRNHPALRTIVDDITMILNTTAGRES